MKWRRRKKHITKKLCNECNNTYACYSIALYNGIHFYVCEMCLTRYQEEKLL